MLKYRKGCVIKALENEEIDILAHGCNLSNGFGSGIAGQIAKRFPKVKAEYHKDIEKIPFEKREMYLGVSHLIEVSEYLNNIGFICNCFTQLEYYPRNKVHADYNAIKKAVDNLNIQYPQLKIGMPKIGAGLAGGDWNHIESIINEVIKEREMYVYVLE